MSEYLTENQRNQLVSFFRMAKIINKTTQKSNEYLNQFGLTIAQLDTLSQIKRHAPLTQQALSRSLMITGGGVSQMLKKLEERGWISRRQDWKVKYIQLTPAGEAVLAEVQPRQSQYQSSLFDGLTAAENAQLENLLRKLQHSLEASEARVES